MRFSLAAIQAMREMLRKRYLAHEITPEQFAAWSEDLRIAEQRSEK